MWYTYEQPILLWTEPPWTQPPPILSCIHQPHPTMDAWYARMHTAATGL